MIYTHVYPLGDTREHITDEDSSECWCGPVIEEGYYIVIHQAQDNREFNEARKRMH